MSRSSSHTEHLAPVRWTSLVGLGLEAAISARAMRLSDEGLWRAETWRIQASQLRMLLRTARDTEFGRRHGFSSLLARSDRDIARAYADAVPLRDWYGFQTEIARMRESGERNVLWPGLVRDYAQTSGTTAGDKYIPVTDAMKRSNFRAALDIFANMKRFGLSIPEVTSGKCLFLGGSTTLVENEHGVRTGDLSGIAATQINWPLSEVYSPGRDIALLGDWPTKIERMAREVMDRDVRMVSGMPSWACVLFERMLAMARARGDRARCVRDIWPNLRVFVHGGVKYTPFEPRVRELWSGDPEGDDIPARLELYPASEGFVAMQDRAGHAGLRLNTDIGLFFEFVPLKEVDSPGARACGAAEVERGQRYVVVLTTCAGLWRYILGDVVEFDDVPDRMNGHGGTGPARLRIVGRHRHFINAFGENIIVEHVENAVVAAARATGMRVGEFTAAPVYPAEGRRAALELVIESDALARAGVFAREFDLALKSQNVDYTTKRTASLGMGEPVVTIVPPGSFHNWMRSRGKLGGQHKCPRCANHRDYVEGVVALARGSRQDQHRVAETVETVPLADREPV